MLDTWIKFIESHERLLLAALGGLVLWCAIGKVDTLLANHDKAGLQQVQIVAQQNAAQTAAVAAQVTRQAADMKELADKLEAQNAQLEQANVALVTALTKQQKTDSTMTPSELTNRWNALVPSANVTVSTNGETLPTSGAVATVQQLEEIPVLRAQIENESSQIANGVTLLTASQGQVVTLNSEVTGLRTQILDNDRVCQAQIKVVKDDARKSKRKWFVVGVVAGAALRGAVKLFFGF